MVHGVISLKTPGQGRGMELLNVVVRENLLEQAENLENQQEHTKVVE